MIDARPASKTFALALALLVATPALSQGTQAQRDACTPDVMRLCREDIPDVPRIIACLRREQAKVSAACQSAMKADEPTTVATRETPVRRAVR
jgi:hypothetical protein